jgi:cell volume regulation protein A
MFLMLGLLVTPARLVGALVPALAIAAVLMLFARPIAVWLCLQPFRFNRAEVGFVSWVGLRGAVPIFLATVPVTAGLPGGLFFFDVAFVVVLASLVLQGWTVTVSARTLGLDLPPHPETPTRIEIDLPRDFGRNVTGYVVGDQARIVGQELDKLALPPNSEVVSALRAGGRLEPGAGHRLKEGDYLLAIAPPEQMAALDRLFAKRRQSGRDSGLLGEFEIDGDAAVTTVMALYDLRVGPEEQSLSLGELLRRRIGRMPVEGDRVRIGELELIVHTIDGDHISKVGLELDPEHQPRRGLAALPAKLRRWFPSLFRRGEKRRAAAP